MDVRIDFTGNATDAQRAAFSIDKALEGIEAVATQVVAALDAIRIDMRQVLEVQTGARTMGVALDGLKVKGTEAAVAVGRVGSGFGRQAAEVVAGSAAASAALRGLEAQAHSTQRSLIATAVLGGTTPTPGAPATMLAAAMRGQTFTGEGTQPRFGSFPYPEAPRSYGFQSAPRPAAPGTALELYRGPNAWARDLVFGTSGAIPMGPGGTSFVSGSSGSFATGRPRMTHHIGGGDLGPWIGGERIPGLGNFGLESSGRHRLFGIGPVVGGGGGLFGGGGITGRFGGGGGSGDGGFFSRGGGFDGGLLGGVLPGGARPTPGAVGALATLGLAAAPNLLPALIGPLAAIPGLAGEGVAAIGALVAAFHGVGKAISGDADAYKRLNAEQQQFVLTARGLGPILTQIRDATTAGLMPGATAGLQRAFSPAAQRTLTTGMGQVGGAIGGSLNQLGGLVGSDWFTGLQGDLFRDGAKNIREMGDATTQLVAALTSFAHGAQPITDWLVHTTDLGARWLANWARMKDETNAFDGYLEKTKTGWHDLIDLVGGAARVVGDFASILGPAGQTLITGLGHGLEYVDEWLKRNHDELQGFANVIAKDVVEAVQIVGPLILKLVETLGHLLEMLSQLPGPLKAIGDAAVVAGIIGVAGGFSAMATAVSGLVKLLPVLQTGLIALAKNPYVAALLAAVGGLAWLSQAGGQVDAAGGNLGSGHVSDAGAASMIKAAGSPKPTYSSEGHRPTYDLGNGQMLQKTASGWQTYYYDSGLNLKPGFAPGYTPPKGVTANAPIAASSTGGGHGFSGTGSGQVYAAGKGVDLMHEDPALMGALNALSLGTNTRLQVTSGFRATGHPGDGPHAGPGGSQTQWYLWEHAAELGLVRGVTVARPGSSDHARGTAADVMAIVNGKGVPITQAFSAAQLAKYGLAGIGSQDAVHVKLMATATGGVTPGTAPVGTPAPWALPIPLQVALARAQTTSGFGDDRAAIGAAMRSVRGSISGGLSGADLVSAYQELKSLQDMLATIGKASGKIPMKVSGTLTNLASVASLISGRTAASGVGSDVSSAMTLEHSLGMPTGVLDSAKGQLAAINAVLGRGFVSNDTLATIRARLSKLAGIVSDELAKAKQAAAARAQEFQSVFEDLAQKAITGFAKETNDVLSHPENHADILPITAKLLGLQDAHTQQQLQQQLQDAQENLAKALAGATSDSSGVLAAAREKIGKDALAHALDVAQSAVLGIKPGDMTDQIIKDMQDALKAALPDPEEVKRAQQAVADAQYQITVYGLQKQSDAEKDAYQEQRSELQTHLQESLKLWESYFADVGHGSAQALADLNSILAKFGLSPISSSLPTNGPPNSQSWADQAGVTSGYSPGIPSDQLADLLFGTPGGLNPATGKPYVGFADGGVSMNPMLARVSEKGPEGHIPLNDPRALQMIGDAIANAGGAGAGTVVYVNVKDDALRDLIEVEVQQQTPGVSYAQGTRANTLLREGRY